MSSETAAEHGLVLVSEFDVVESLTALTTQCVELVGAAAAGVLIADETGRLGVVGSSTEQVRLLELFQIEAHLGPCLDAYASGEIVINTDLRAASVWPAFAEESLRNGFLSVCAIPISFEGVVLGCLNLFMTETVGLSESDLDLAQALAHAAARAVTRQRLGGDASSRTTGTQHSFTAHDSVEQAKVLIAEHCGIDLDHAFSRLRSYARFDNRNVTETAESVLTGSIDIDSFDQASRDVIAADVETDPRLVGVADRFQLLVDAVEEYGIFTLDLEGNIMSWNSGAQRVAGYSAKEIIGQNFSTFYELEDREGGKPQRELARTAALGQNQLEGWRVRKDGSLFWANVVITALTDAAGHLSGFANVTRDATERKSAETAVREAIVAAERTKTAKDEFISRMSHELRTPLNAILGFGQLLEMDALPAQQRDSVGQIVSAGRHLLELIDEVLDISRLETGEMRLTLEPVSVVEVTAEAVAMIRPLADRRQIRLAVTATAPEVHVQADRQRVKQVVVNLLANAVKYNRAHGDVDIASELLDTGRLRLTITDTGLGITDEDLGRLFQPFERLSAGQSPVEGTGLGLALSKDLTRAMNGEIGVSSRVGEGSSFWVEFPTTDAPFVERRRKHRRAADVARLASLRTKTVLYVEDNLSNVKLVERVLTHRPEVTLMVAMQGRMALDMAVEHRPELILLDLHLPDISGEVVLRALRADARTARIPVVVLSADATSGQASRLLSQGANDYLTKPFDIARLLSMVDNVGTTRHHRDAERDGTCAGSGSDPSAQNNATDSGSRVDDRTTVIPRFVHDLNNALGLISNYTTLLARSESDAQIALDITEIRMATEQAVRLTSALLITPITHTPARPKFNHDT